MGNDYILCKCNERDNNYDLSNLQKITRQSKIPVIKVEDVILNNANNSMLYRYKFNIKGERDKYNNKDLNIYNYRSEKIKMFEIDNEEEKQKEINNQQVEQNKSFSVSFSLLNKLSPMPITIIDNNNNGKKNGFGIKLWDKDYIYKGNFKDDNATGFGKYISFKDNENYQGEFLNNVACGYGIFNNNNNVIYEGYWIDDFQDLLGIEEWKDGSFYKGEFSFGKKHGIGTYIWPDGTKYEGQWYKNNFDGFGIYYYNDNKVYKGEWKNNKKDGFGEFIWDDKKYVGFYSNNKKEGFGIIFFNKVNKIFLGFWKKGGKSGIGKIMSKNKRIFGIWQNNKNIKWFQHKSEAFKVLNDLKLAKYINIFSLSYDELINLCKNNENNIN